MASLLRRYTAGFVREHAEQAPPHVQSTLAKLSLCRTAALGGHWYQCDACHDLCVLYNSCGDRHCSQCAGAKRRDWLTKTSGLLLPGIDYYQVVFTMPDRLSSLALGNRRELFTLLFHAAWAALQSVIRTEQGFDPAAAMVLHTWNQKLDAHVHVHALVPGGGPAVSGGDRWARSQRRDAHGHVCGQHHNRYWLVDADTLRVEFRKRFLAGLKRLHRKGELKLTGEWSHLADSEAFEAWLEPLEDTNWVTHIVTPKNQESSPEHVVKYLARYLTGGPISDRRLVSQEHGQVTFTARVGDTPGGDPDAVEEVTLPGVEFVRRWCLHILPAGYVKTRCYGGWSNTRKKDYLSRCRELLPDNGTESATLPDSDPDLSAELEPGGTIAGLCCPYCEGPLRLVSSQHPPSWHDVLNGQHRPAWYTRGSPPGTVPPERTMRSRP